MHTKRPEETPRFLRLRATKSSRPRTQRQHPSRPSPAFLLRAVALDRCGGTRSAPLVPALWHRMGKAPLHGVKAPPLHPHLSQCLLAATHRVGKRPGRRTVTWDRAKSATHTTDLIKSPARAAPPLWLLARPTKIRLICHRNRNHVGAECSHQLAHALAVHHPVQQATARCECRRLPTAHGKDRPPHDLMP